MPIKTNLKSLAPRREQYRKEITLLSHGYTNPKAWPDGRITVYPWDNEIDQWLVDNARRLSKMDLFYGLVAKCCNLNGGSVDDLIADEVTTILLVSKALASDCIIQYTSVCPHCGNKTEEQIKVPDELEKIGEKSAGYPGYDLITLPIVKDVVAIRPLTVRDEKEIFNRPEHSKRLYSDIEIRTLLRVVHVNETKPDTLDELVTWYRALHATDAKFLERQGQLITPHLNTDIVHVCEDPACGREFKHTLTFDQDFFR
jgi:hypothetical protein